MVMMKMIPTPMELKYWEIRFDDCPDQSRSPGRGSRSRRTRTRRPTCPSCSYGAAPAQKNGGGGSPIIWLWRDRDHEPPKTRGKHRAAENGGLPLYQAFIKHNMQNGTKNPHITTTTTTYKICHIWKMGGESEGAKPWTVERQKP